MSQALRQKEEEPKDSKRSAPLFGVNINPYASQIGNSFRIAKLADELGLDTIGIQDHPYNGSFIDTWTFLTALAVSTRRVHFFTNVADLPLRPAAAAADHVASTRSSSTRALSISRLSLIMFFPLRSQLESALMSLYRLGRRSS